MTLHFPTPRRVLRGSGVALAAVLLVACGGSAQDSATDDPAVTESPALQATPPETATPAPRETESPASAPPEGESTDTETLEVVIEGDSISPNTAELSLPVGGSLTLEITADRVGEFHVHARPESYVQFGPGTTSETLTFEHPGTVEIEEHDTGFAIAVIEVR